MGMLQRTHPLDRLINDESLFLLEAMVPFVDYNTKKILVVLIKVREISAIMNALNNPSYLNECGFNCHPKSTDEFISDMCNFMPNDFKNTVSQMQQMMSMMNLMNSMNGMNAAANENQYDNFSGNDNTDIFSELFGNESSQSNQNSHMSRQEESGSLFDNVMSIIENEGN